MGLKDGYFTGKFFYPKSSTFPRFNHAYLLLSLLFE